MPLLPFGEAVHATMHTPDLHLGLNVQTADPPPMGCMSPFWDVTFKVTRNWPDNRACFNEGFVGLTAPPPRWQAVRSRLSVTRATRADRMRILTCLPVGTLT